MSYIKKLTVERESLLNDLTKVQFQVKIIDYGLSKLLFNGMLADTPHGTIELIAPEVLDAGYDHRVDIWGVGVMFYMLIALDYMFDTKNQPQQGKWCISTNLNYSIEALRFINETVQFDRGRRQFPNKLVDHPYFKYDVSKQQTIKERLNELKMANLMCLDHLNHNQIDVEDQSRLWFDAKDPSIFEELYVYYTGLKDYSIPIL